MLTFQGHNLRDMPLWRDEYLAKAEQKTYDPETLIRIRILVLIETHRKVKKVENVLEKPVPRLGLLFFWTAGTA